MFGGGRGKFGHATKEFVKSASHNNNIVLIKQIFLFDTASSYDKYLKFQFKLKEKLPTTFFILPQYD